MGERKQNRETSIAIAQQEETERGNRTSKIEGERKQNREQTGGEKEN